MTRKVNKNKICKKIVRDSQRKVIRVGEIVRKREREREQEIRRNREKELKREKRERE